MPRGETAQQIALLEWAAYVRVGAFNLSDLLVHVPNGGKRTKAEAGILKAMGVKAGWPDLQLMMPMGEYHGAFWELKDAGESPTAVQYKCHVMLRDFGYYVRWFRDWETCAEDIESYLALPRWTQLVTNHEEKPYGQAPRSALND